MTAPSDSVLMPEARTRRARPGRAQGGLAGIRAAKGSRRALVVLIVAAALLLALTSL